MHYVFRRIYLACHNVLQSIVRRPLASVCNVKRPEEQAKIDADQDAHPGTSVAFLAAKLA